LAALARVGSTKGPAGVPPGQRLDQPVPGGWGAATRPVRQWVLSL